MNPNRGNISLCTLVLSEHTDAADIERESLLHMQIGFTTRTDLQYNRQSISEPFLRTGAVVANEEKMAVKLHLVTTFVLKLSSGYYHNVCDWAGGSKLLRSSKLRNDMYTKPGGLILVKANSNAMNHDK